MTATEILRRMLDERGVEHEGGERSLRWRDRYGIMMQAFPLANGELGMDVWSCTPEQAIAATLGAVEYRKPTTLSQLEAENAKLRDGAAKMAQWYDEELKASLAENTELRELVRNLVRSTHPADRATLIANAIELGVEAEE